MVSTQESTLQDKYIKSLPNKLKNLQGEFQGEDWESLCSSLHKLTGSAGMYGFDDMSNKARALYLSLENDLNDKNIINSSMFVEGLNELFEIMIQESLIED